MPGGWLRARVSGPLDVGDYRPGARRRSETSVISWFDPHGVASVSGAGCCRATLPQLGHACPVLLRMGALQGFQDRLAEAACDVSSGSSWPRGQVALAVQSVVGCAPVGASVFSAFRLAGDSGDALSHWVCAKRCCQAPVSSAGVSKHWVCALLAAASPTHRSSGACFLRGQCAFLFGCYPLARHTSFARIPCGFPSFCPASPLSGLGLVSSSAPGAAAELCLVLDEALRASSIRALIREVPKCCIGGAGATTSLSFWGVLLDAVCAGLSGMQPLDVLRAVPPFFLALAGLTLAILWQFLGAAFPGRRTPLGSLLWSLPPGLPLTPILCIGAIGSLQARALDWSPCAPSSRVRRRSGRRRSCGCCGFPGGAAVYMERSAWSP